MTGSAVPVQRAAASGRAAAAGAVVGGQRGAAPGRGRAEKRRVAVVDQQRSDGELDELARRLVEPLARLLRAELRMDRERVGRLRDRRR